MIVTVISRSLTPHAGCGVMRGGEGWGGGVWWVTMHPTRYDLTRDEFS